jgi:uncharacterized membrane protein
MSNLLFLRLIPLLVRGGWTHRKTIQTILKELQMNSKTAMLAAAVGSLFAVHAPSILAADDPTTEKCYGVAKAGKNDCAGPGHVCSGLAKTDGDPGEYVTLPKGTCERIVGGILKGAAT